MARSFDTLRAVGLTPTTFLCVLALASLAGASAFTFTMLSSGLPSHQQRGTGQTERRRSFGNAARYLYSIGADRNVISLCQERRDAEPRDPEGWLFAAFAHERLGNDTGLIAMRHRAHASSLWGELLTKARETPIRSGAYFEGWALTGLGRPVMARERFGVHLDQVTSRRFAPTSYNLACYLALEGSVDEAQDAFVLAATQPRVANGAVVDPLWAACDPDLAALFGTLPYEIGLAYNTMPPPERARRAQRRAPAPGPVAR